jgi:hypothetical protein
MVGLKMNERIINQFEEKAKNYASNYEIGSPMWFLFYNKKFAELIVQECAEMGDNFDGQPTGNAVRKYLTAGDAIREYFGVTE